MNPLLKIFLYLFIIFGIAALLSPPLFWLGSIGAHHYHLSCFFPFHRYFSRVVQITALILLYPFLRWLGIRHWRELGIQKNPNFWREIVLGWGLAVLPLILLDSGFFFLDLFHVRKSWATAVSAQPLGDASGWDGMHFLGVVIFVLSASLKALVTAAVVATVEELLFRAMLLGLMVRELGVQVGLWGVTLIFAGVHFLKPLGEINTVTWWSGWQWLGSAFSLSFVSPLMWSQVWGFGTLMGIGWILGWVTLRTRSLAWAIGLHSGWVFGQLMFNRMATRTLHPLETGLPWIGPNVVSGLVPTGLLPLGTLLITGVLLMQMVSVRQDCKI